MHNLLILFNYFWIKVCFITCCLWHYPRTDSVQVWAVLKPGFLALLADPFDTQPLDIIVFDVLPASDGNGDGRLSLAKEIKERNPLRHAFKVSSTEVFSFFLVYLWCSRFFSFFLSLFLDYNCSSSNFFLDFEWRINDSIIWLHIAFPLNVGGFRYCGLCYLGVHSLVGWSCVLYGKNL